MAKTLMLRTLSGLQPTDDMGREALRGIKVGEHVAVEVTRPRNIRHHRLYWQLCQSIAEAVGAKAESVSDVIKVRTGHVTVVKTASGLMEFPRSISFAKMDQAGFSAFFDDACRVVCSEFIPHMKPSELRNDILRMTGVPVEEVA
jgi:hypothetical protein